MRLLGFDKFYIELLELFPGSSKDELTARENSIIRERGASLNSLSHYKAKTRSNKTQDDIIDTKPLGETTEPPQPVEPLENEVLTEHHPQENNHDATFQHFVNTDAQGATGLADVSNDGNR